jgi:16S rRNA (cytosine1402-N4)-methyltransferase
MVDAGPGFEHRPVMVERITDVLGAVGGGILVDATLGGAGHAESLLAAHPSLRLIGIDRDGDALAASAERLAPLDVPPGRITLERARFDQIGEVVASHRGDDPVMAVLFDLGVSSPQLDRADRGFSYRQSAPLDMRMDQREARSAADVVNTYSEAELASVLRRFGDERYAGRIARAVVAARPLTTTTELADLVRDAIPAPARRRGGHPAKRTFQAIRIEVNHELDILADALDQAIDLLSVGGRLAVLSYHSGEDRIVKDRLRQAETGGCVCPPGLPCVCGAERRLRLLTRGGWTPTEAERTANRRAESARLRAGERIDPATVDATGSGPVPRAGRR